MPQSTGFLGQKLLASTGNATGCNRARDTRDTRDTKPSAIIALIFGFMGTWKMD